MKKNRIIVIADEGEVLWESLVLPEQQTEIYQAKNIQDALSHLTVFSYHLILIAVKQEPEIICQLVETIRKMVITPVIVLLPDHSEIFDFLKKYMKIVKEYIDISVNGILILKIFHVIHLLILKIGKKLGKK